jgi:Dolichyl-phosphate-mannose-protein mannosyltransferase
VTTDAVTSSASGPRSWLSALTAFARREPRRCLAIVLILHVVIWTALPLLLAENLQLDLAEGLALGREWQLGYWKLPPLPWWLIDATHQITGTVLSVYLLGPLASALAIYIVWRMGNEVADPVTALLAALALEGLHFFNFTAVKFNHDVLQLPLWALTGLFLYRALAHGRILDWLLTAVAIALALWTKYAIVVLVLPLLLFVLADRAARGCLRTAGPYVAAALFALLIAPHLWWLVEHAFMPFQYADARAKVATRWYQFITYPAQWIGSQIFFLAPTLALLALTLAGSRAGTPADDRAAFARRYVTVLAFGPFAVTTLGALALGRLPVALWGYPFWSFMPLAVLLWLGPVTDPARLKRFIGGFVAIFIAMPVAYAAVEGLEPLVRDRAKATQFPGHLLAETVTRQWHDKFNTPLAYVGGGEFAANNIAVYSADRPHVLVHGELAKSPWIDRADLERRGAVIVWEDGQADATRITQWQAAFPGFVVTPSLTLPRQTLTRGARAMRPVHVNIAIIPPRP